jgi:hypothetical protein
MSEPRVRTYWEARSEGIALRPYAGLEPLENHLHSQVFLSVRYNEGTQNVGNKKTLELSPKDLVNIGLSISLGSIEQLVTLVNPLVMSPEDVDVLVVAMDRPTGVLKDQVLVYREPLLKCIPEIMIAESGAEKIGRMFGNARAGFKIELAFVHNKDIEGDFSIRPRRKGALLAKAVFEVRPVAIGDSLQPTELTPKVREDNGLGPDVWMFFDPKPGLLDSDSFDDALAFYVDKRVLESAKVVPQPTKTIIEAALLSNAMNSFVHCISNALKEEHLPDMADLQSSQVMRYLAGQFPKISFEDLLNDVREQPQVVAAKMTGNPKIAKKLFSQLETIGDSTDDLSDNQDS